MEPWIQPTTAPRQPDVADEEVSEDEEIRVERGWMEDLHEASEAAMAERSHSIAIVVFTVAVVLGFLLLVMFAFPFLLLAN